MREKDVIEELQERYGEDNKDEICERADGVTQNLAYNLAGFEENDVLIVDKVAVLILIEQMHSKIIELEARVNELELGDLL